MARAPDERIKEAHALYKKGMKLVDIATKLNIPPGTVRRWKSTHKWDSERSDKKSERSPKRKSGGQPGNKNAVGNKGGAPIANTNATVKHGLFKKYIPQETLDIMAQMSKDPLDILWDNIMIQYGAIIRAQHIMYVKDINDKTTTLIAESNGDTVSEKWEVQQAWDKQANYLSAQSRAMKTLESMLKRYDEMLHANWDLATEEQKARIASLRAKVDEPEAETEDDGFIDALKGSANEDWADEG